MRILAVATELPPERSGVARTCGQLLDVFRANGHQVDVVRRRDFPYFHLGEIRLSLPLLGWRRMRRKVQSADLVYLMGPAPTFIDAFFVLLSLERKRPPVIYTHQFDIDFRGFGWLCEAYNRCNSWLARRTSDVIVVTTQAYRYRFPGFPNLEVVPWGSDHDEPPPARHSGTATEAALRVLFVGQLRPYKGIEFLLEAMTGLDSVSFTVAGNGSRQRHLERRAHSLGLEEAVDFRGAVTDSELRALMSSSDVIVMPSISRQEAFGMALLEGMRAGCVPLASKLPGVAEVVGDAGLLCPPRDSVSLASALAKLRDDRDLRAQMASRAVRRADEFRWEDTHRSYLALVEDLGTEPEQGG